MKRNSTFFLSFLLTFFLSVGMYAQDHVFPTFTKVTPDGAPLTFRGNGTWGDYNNDGKMDLVYVGRDIADGWATHIVKLTNNGIGFDVTEDFGIPASGIYNAVLQWIDYNNDGNLDLLYVGTTNGETSNAAADVFAFLYKNTGADGDYAFAQVEETGLSGYYFEQEGNYGSVISVGDANNDGYPDILITGNIDGVRYVDLYKNNEGDGTFELQEQMVDGFFNFDGLSSGSATFGDVDSDGKLDVLASGWNDNEGDALAKMYKNLGDFQFEDAYIEDTAKGTQKGQLAWLDINNDGNQDFLITGERMGGGWPKMADLYINDGEGGFTLKSSEETFIDPLKNSSVDYADIDNDGLLDLIMAGEGNEQHTWIYLNNGDLTFDAELDRLGKVRSGAVIALADFNNDGHLDGFSCGYGNDGGAESSDGSITMIWENNGDGTANTAPVAPTNLQSSYEDGVLTLSWDAGTDTETPAEALKYNIFVKKSDDTTLMLVPADTTTGFLKVAELTGAVVTTSFSLNIADGTYEWGVQTIDQGKAGSTFAKATYSSDGGGTGISDLLDNANINAFNRNGQIYVELDNEIASVTVYNLSGKQVMSETNVQSGMLKEINRKGIYFVKIQTQKGAKTVKVALF